MLKVNVNEIEQQDRGPNIVQNKMSEKLKKLEKMLKALELRNVATKVKENNVVELEELRANNVIMNDRIMKSHLQMEELAKQVSLLTGTLINSNIDMKVKMATKGEVLDTEQRRKEESSRILERLKRLREEIKTLGRFDPAIIVDAEARFEWVDKMANKLWKKMIGYFDPETHLMLALDTNTQEAVELKCVKSYKHKV